MINHHVLMNLLLMAGALAFVFGVVLIFVGDQLMRQHQERFGSCLQQSPSAYDMAFGMFCGGIAIAAFGALALCAWWFLQ